MNALHDPLALISRCLLAVMFLLTGISKIGAFADTSGDIASKGLPMPDVVGALTIAVEIGGALALVVGVCTRWAALVHAAFTLLAALIFHNYWDTPAAQQSVQ